MDGDLGFMTSTVNNEEDCVVSVVCVVCVRHALNIREVASFVNGKSSDAQDALDASLCVCECMYTLSVRTR